MDRIMRLRATLERHQSVLFDAVRIYLGLALFAKGLYFVTHQGDVAALLEAGSGGHLAGTLLVGHYVALAHLAGGALLAVGLVTRLAALVQVPVLVGAVALVHVRESLFGVSPNLELALLVLFLLVLCVVHGGGRLSVDAWLTRSFKEHSLPPPVAT